MELNEYLAVIRKHLFMFFSIVILATALAFILTKIRPETYTAATTFTASKSSIVNPIEIYDEEKKICTTAQLSSSYSQIVTLWFTSPAIINEIYQQADLTVPNITQDKLAKTFKAVYTPEGVIRVTITGRNQGDIVKLLNAANVLMQSKTAYFSDLDKNRYKLTEDLPIVTQDNPSILLNTLVGLIIGFILAMLSVMAIEYFKTSRR